VYDFSAGIIKWFKGLPGSVKERWDGLLISLYLTDWRQQLQVLGKNLPAAGSLLAVVLALVGLLLIWLRRARRPADFAADPPREHVSAESIPQAGNINKMLEKIWSRVYRRYGRKLPSQTMREYVATRDAAHPDSLEALAELARFTEEAGFGPGLCARWSKRRMAALAKRIVSRD
jgi:hypothetical protein